MYRRLRPGKCAQTRNTAKVADAQAQQSTPSREGGAGTFELVAVLALAALCWGAARLLFGMLQSTRNKPPDVCGPIWVEPPDTTVPNEQFQALNRKPTRLSLIKMGAIKTEYAFGATNTSSLLRWRACRRRLN